MKYLVLLLLPLSSMSQDNKELHFVSGFGVGYVCSSSRQLKPSQAFFVSTGSSLFAGLAKEVYDSQKGYRVSHTDIAYTVAGGMVAGVLKYYIKKKRKKRYQ